MTDKNRSIGATVGQIQWMLFFCSLAVEELFIVWTFSLFLSNKKEDGIGDWKRD